jgi:hypothetical protein
MKLGNVVALGAAGLLAVAGCGDDGDDSGGGGSLATFCEEYSALEDRFANLDPNDADAVDEAFEAVRDLDVPDEIADDFETAVEALEALGDIDVTDTEAVEEFFSGEFADAEQAFTNLDEFVAEECGDAAE